MLPFLSTFLETFSAIENKQVFRLLRQMRDTGEISTSEEFNEALRRLASLLIGENSQGVIPLLRFNNRDLLESDAARTFIHGAKSDMDVLLGETEYLSNALRAHVKLLTDNYFDAIELALKDLEIKTRAFEVLEQRKWSGFDKVLQSYNFRGTESVPARALGGPSGTLLLDQRSGEPLSYSPPYKGGEGLHLAIKEDTSREEPFYSVEILTDATTPQTEFSIAPSNYTVLNVIDGKTETHWKHSVLLSEHPFICNLKLSLVFPGPRRVNALVLHGLADIPMKLGGIEYIDEGETRRSITVGSMYSGSGASVGLLGETRLKALLEDLPNEDVVIPLGDITARRIIVTLRQSTAIDGEFYYIEDSGEWLNPRDAEAVWVAVGKVGLAGTEISQVVERTAPGKPGTGGIRRAATEVEVYGDMLARVTSGRQRANFHEYVFGLRRAIAISRDFYPTGVFVPEPFETEVISTLGLYSDYETQDEIESCEFFLKKENYDAAGILQDIEMVPLPPFGATLVSESLPLIARSAGTGWNDVGLTRFYPNFSETFRVFESGRELTLGSHYLVSVDGGGTWESALPPIASPITPWSCRIKFLAVDTSETYTLRYTPLGSGEAEGSEVWLNPALTACLERDFTLTFDNLRAGGNITKNKITLQIVTKANSRKTRESPYVREIVLLGGANTIS